MWMFVLIPFTLQAVAIGIDEAYFHYKRGLPFWERIGHPLDTLSFLMCLLFVWYMPFSEENLKIFGALALFSCVMVTKDEFVHKDHCPGSENWLHAVLFLLHPITLVSAACIWPVIQGVEVPLWFSAWLDQPLILKWFLGFQCVSILLFFFYQLIFWNVVWKNKPVIKY